MNKCPVCGYVEKHDVKMPSNVMSRYVRLADKSVVVVNDTDKEIKDKDGKVIMILESEYKKQVTTAPAPTVQQTPATPKTVTSSAAKPAVTVPPSVHKAVVIPAPVVKETNVAPPVTLPSATPDGAPQP